MVDREDGIRYERNVVCEAFFGASGLITRAGSYDTGMNGHSFQGASSMN